MQSHDPVLQWLRRNIRRVEEIPQQVELNRLTAAGGSVIVIEHNMDVVMNNCERVVVLSMGEKIAEGSPEEVRRDEAVLTAYFGA